MSTKNKKKRDKNNEVDDGSYFFSANHRRRRTKQLTMIVLVIVGAIAVSAAVVFATTNNNTKSSPLDGNNNMEPLGPLIMHVHPRLQLFIRGQNVTIPANVGLDPALWKNHDLAIYSDNPGAESPLHTHDSSGVIHVESTVTRNYTLGDFFNVWGVKFTDSCITDNCNNGKETVKMFVDGKLSTEFARHILRDNERIAIVYS